MYNNRIHPFEIRTWESMYYRLSNIVERDVIEKELGRPFKYPNLYEPKPIVNGLKESIIPVVTSSEKQVISFAIWGILPEGYREDWDLFQNVFNTLNLSRECLEDDLWYSKGFQARRCLIIASGFFTYYLHKGDIFPYYVHASSNIPLCLGGVYNQLDDGFITCAMIIVNSNGFIRKIQNIDRGMPLLIDTSIRQKWLDPGADRQEIIRYVCDSREYDLTAHPIEKDFYLHRNKEVDILQPVDYGNLPLS